MRPLQDLSDDDLVASIATLTGTAREATAALVAHLAELETRGLHLALGFRSLYGYCRTILHLSEHESYNRMDAAGVARRFPVILPLLADGLLHLTAICLLGPRLDDENHLALLGGAIHKSKREVEELLARWFPKEEVGSSVRKLPAADSMPAAVALAPATDAPAKGPSVGGPGAPVVMPNPGATTPSPSPRPSVLPLSADRYLVKFTASDATLAKLTRAQELLSHSVPSGDVSEIIDRALTALLEQAEKRKHAATARPRPGREIAPASRSIPAAVERAVWARDGGRCAFTGGGGRRCDERRFLEFHHVRPWVVGGAPITANIALRCRAHNAYEAAVYFGPIREAREARTRSGTSSSRESVSLARTSSCETCRTGTEVRQVG